MPAQHAHEGEAACEQQPGNEEWDSQPERVDRTQHRALRRARVAFRWLIGNLIYNEQSAASARMRSTTVSATDGSATSLVPSMRSCSIVQASE
jgi:hypothetical protein